MAANLLNIPETANKPPRWGSIIERFLSIILNPSDTFASLWKSQSSFKMKEIQKNLCIHHEISKTEQTIPKLNERKDTTKEKKDAENDALVVTWIGDNLLLNRLNLSLLRMLLLSSWPRWTTAESRDAAESDFIKHNKLSKQQKRVP